MLGLALAPSAQAGPGDHVRIGSSGELIPELSVGSEFQSNPFMVEGNPNNPERQVVRGIALMASPGLRLDWSSDALDLQLSANLTARQYLNASARNLSRFTDSKATLNANILPKAPVGLLLVNGYSLDNRPSEARFAGSTDANEDGRPFITQIHNGAEGYLSVHPGGRLTVDVGGTFTVDDFRSNPTSNSSGNTSLNNRYQFGPRVDVRWAFFPKTALQGSASFGRVDWQYNSINTSEGSSIEFSDPRLAIPDGLSWRVQGGLVGRFTKKIVLNTTVGYGQLRYDSESVLEGLNDNIPFANTLDPDTQGWGAADVTSFGEGLLATAKLTWAPRKNQSVSLGYIKDYEDSWFTNYVAYHYGFLSYEGNVSRRWQLGASAGYRRESYRGHLNRDDQVIRIDGEVSYTLQKWAVISLDAGWHRRVPATLTSDLQPLATTQWDNFPVALTLRLLY